MPEIEETPHDDHVVVNGDHEAGDSRCQAETAQEGMHLIPNTHTAQAKALSDGKLQIQHWHSFDDQHHQIRYEESTRDIKKRTFRIHVLVHVSMLG